MARLQKYAGFGVGLLTACWLSSVAAASNELVVLSSTAPKFTIGQVRPVDEPLSLPDGATVVFLLSTGRTMTINGPYNGAPDEPSRSAASVMQSLLDSGRLYQKDIAGTRSLHPSSANVTASDVLVDVDKGGVYCVFADSQVQIERSKSAGPATIRIESAQSGAASDIRWQGAERQKPWPSVLPFYSSSAFRITGSAGGPPVVVEFRKLDGTGLGYAAKVAAIAAGGCSAQAQPHLKQLRNALVPLNLNIWSDRGKYPTYQIGETITVNAQSNRDAYCYCQVLDAHGRLIPVFPPTSGEARIAEHTPVSILGRDREFDFAAEGISGDVQLRCIASERDLKAELPREFAVAGYTAITADAAAKFDSAITNLQDGEVLTTEITFRIH